MQSIPGVAKDQVRSEAETLRSMQHPNLHRVVESFEVGCCKLETSGAHETYIYIGPRFLPKSGLVSPLL